MLLKYLSQIPDHRRSQGRQYQLSYVLLFSIFAILCGASRYQDIADFITVHFERLDEIYDMKWTRAPAYTTVRNVIQGTNKFELEKAFRNYTEELLKIDDLILSQCLAIDGKALRGSFDHFNDKKALHILNIFSIGSNLIIGHYDTDNKSNEIPAVQEFLKEIDLTGYIFTIDAMHCQKKHLR